MQNGSRYAGVRRTREAPKVIAALILRTIGAPGFEPGTFWSQTRRATGLRYAPSALRASSYLVPHRHPNRIRPATPRAAPGPRRARGWPARGARRAAWPAG